MSRISYVISQKVDKQMVESGVDDCNKTRGLEQAIKAQFWMAAPMISS